MARAARVHRFILLTGAVDCLRLEILVTAVEQVIADLTGCTIVTRWMLLAEVVKADGSRALETYYDPEFIAWDRLGMLRTAVLRAEARLVGGL
jgi:hypothetical protein